MKTQRWLLSLAVIITAAMLWSCEDPFGIEKDVNQIKILNYEKMFQGSNIFLTRNDVRMVIRNTTEEAEFISLVPLKVHSDVIKAMFGFDKIDYSKEMVIVIGLSTRPNSSNYVNIDAIKSSGGKIRVSSTEYVFTSGQYRSGFPLLIVKLKSSADEVIFEATKVKAVNDNSDRELPFQTILKGNHIVQYPYGVPKFQMVITDKSEEVAWLSAQIIGRTDEQGNEIKLQLPETDYTRFNLIVMQPGMTSSGSNVFEITNVRLEGVKVKIYSTITTNGMTTDIGHPLHLIRVEKLALEHIFLPTKELPGNDPENPLNLKGTTWKWTSYINSLGVMFDVNSIPGYEDDPTVKSDNFKITFDDSTFSGQSNCNAISGNYKVSGDNIQFTDIVSTMIYCKNAGFDSGLYKSYKIYRNGDNLTLDTYDYGMVNMYFERVP